MPASVFAADPFVMVYEELWTLAERSERLKSMVRAGNRIKWNSPSRTGPDKYEVSEGDLPELSLVVIGVEASLRSSSSASYATLSYQWQISTGDQNVERQLLPLMWAVYAAMCDWPVRAPQLLWNNKPFINLVEMKDAQLGLANAQQNRGIQGWSALWTTTVQLGLKTSEVLASNSA